MNAIVIPINLTSLSMLLPVGVNTYQMVVQLFKADGVTPLDQAGVPNEQTITFVTTNFAFNLNYPVTEGVYNISGKLKVFANNKNSACIKVADFSIFNSLTTTTTTTTTSTTTTIAPSAAARFVYLNTTGYGFDINHASGINPQWHGSINAFNNMSYNGVNFSGINGVRLLVRWYEYEPVEGVFRDNKIIDALNFCKGKGLKLSICFWPLRLVGDGLIPDNERMCGSRSLTDYFLLEGDKYVPAPYSTNGKQKLKNVVKHLAQTLSAYPNDVDYMSCALGETEEFYMPCVKTNTGERLALTGYSAIDRAAWAPYAAANGFNGANPPVSANAADAFTTGDMWNTPIGSLWFNFITDGLASIHAYFRDGVREGGMRVCAVYPDCGGAQSSWEYNYRLNKIFAGCDIYYSSEGGNRYDTYKKHFATDFNLGTFNKDVGIEFDPEDLSTDGSTYYGNPVDSERLRVNAISFFRRGGKYVHMAMAFAYGEDGNPNNIAPLAPALYDLQMNYCPVGANIVPLPQLTPINTTITSFKGDAAFVGQWNNSGASNNTQVKIILT